VLCEDVEGAGGGGGRAGARDESVALAAMLGGLPGFSVLCIDTESRFVRRGVMEEVARAARGVYFALPAASSCAVSEVAQDAIRGLKGRL